MPAVRDLKILVPRTSLPPSRRGVVALRKPVPVAALPSADIRVLHSVTKLLHLVGEHSLPGRRPPSGRHRACSRACRVACAEETICRKKNCDVAKAWRGKRGSYG